MKRSRFTGPCRQAVTATAFFCILLSMLNLLPLWVLASNQAPSSVIRVGFPIQEGLTEIDARGNHRGYTYDYLMEIASYTGWSYEFVTPEGDQNQQLSTLTAMLESGEIDLLGAMAYREDLAERYHYAATSYGYASFALFTLAENTELTSANYYEMPTLRVAVLRSSQLGRAALESFSQTNDIRVEQIPVDGEEEMLTLLKRGQADLLLQMDIGSSFEGRRLVSRISERPFYFAAAKNRFDVVRGVNMAQSRINEQNPSLPATLRQRYFSNGDPRLYFSTQERKYLEQTDVIHVLLSDGFAPLQYLDSNGEMLGLSVDLAKYLSEQTGVPFEIRVAASPEEFYELLQSGDYPLIGGLSNLGDYSDYPTLSLSSPYLTAPTFLVLSENLGPDQLSGKRLALSQPLFYSGHFEGDPLLFGTAE